MNCKATTKAGKACKAKVLTNQRYCFTHSPSNAQARAKARRLGGLRSRTPHGGELASLPSEIRNIEQARAILDYALAELLPMDNGIARVRILISLFEAFVKSIELGAHEERIAALESERK